MKGHNAGIVGQEKFLDGEDGQEARLNLREVSLNINIGHWMPL